MGKPKKPKAPKVSQEQKELERLQIAQLKRADAEEAELRRVTEAARRARSAGRQSLIATSGAGVDAPIRRGVQNRKEPGVIFINGVRQSLTQV